MKSLTAGSVSGCLIWLLGFIVVAPCLISVATFAGGLSSAFLAEPIARLFEPYLCPDNSKAEIVYSLIHRFSVNIEMQCVNANGSIVRGLSPDYAYYWIGLLMVGSLVVSGLLPLLLAAPLGALVTRSAHRSRGANL